MLLLGLAMVSTLPYRSFKDLDLRNRVPFMAVLVQVGGFILVSFDPPIVLSVLSLTFFVSGPIAWLVLRGSHASTSDAEVSDSVAEDDSS
jgi:CDP-diacylglycerol--serine O-phosphatidyltransferase